jgi:hypothetical protein
MGLRQAGGGGGCIFMISIGIFGLSTAYYKMVFLNRKDSPLPANQTCNFSNILPTLETSCAGETIFVKYPFTPSNPEMPCHARWKHGDDEICSYISIGTCSLVLSSLIVLNQSQPF